MKKINVILMVLWVIGSSYAQPLETLINEAVENNLEIRALSDEYNAALERPVQVSQLPDPEIGIGASILPVETRLGPQIARISATQMIPWKGILDKKSDLELAKAKALNERIGIRELDLSYQIEQAYYQLYQIEQSQSIIQRNLGIVQALERLALSRVESGKTTAADVLRAQIKIEELNQELEILETSKAKPISDINQLMNRELDAPIVMTDSLAFAVIPLDRNALSNEISANHPLLRMFKYQQEISREAINLNALDGKPAFGVGLDYIMVNKRGNVELERNGRDIIQLRAAIKIPLNRQKYAAKEREENYKITALDNRKDNTLNQFMSAIEKAYADYETAQLRMDLYLRQKVITRSAINILETDYSTSGNNFDELLQLEKELIDYDLKMLKAIVQSHLAKSSIERFLK